MKNLLRDQLSLDEITATLRNSLGTPLLSRLGDAVWTDAPKKQPLQQFLPALRDRALAEIHDPLPILTDELYADYHNTGVRVRFEKLYFERRRRLARAAIATLIETELGQRQKLAASLLQKMRDIFAETSWALPAHVNNHPTGKDPNVIDLFAAETANLFAELLSVFSWIVPPVSAAEIRHRLRTQVFENYLNNQHYWMNRDSNWNAVCHQGVIGAALTIEDDPELLARMLHRAAQHLPNFLHGYGNDGATAEGPGYWAYGFGWFTELNLQLEHRTEGKLSLFHNDPKINAIARFGPSTLLQNNFTLNFSDGSPRARLRAALLQYLSHRLDDPFIGEYADAAWRSANPAELLDDQRGDFLFLSRYCLFAPQFTPPDHTLPLHDIYWPDAQWVLSRSRGRGGHILEFAAKAGHNDENHNHNDLASWLLHVDGQRAFIEIGAPEYTRQFFANETRYQHIATRSVGHPVPLINGIEQAQGPQFRATGVNYQATPELIHFSLDLTHAYPPAASVTRAHRVFLLDKSAAALTVTDSFDLTQTTALESALISLTKPIIENNTARLPLDGLTLLITAGPNTLVHEVQTHTYNDHAARPTQIHRLVLIPQSLTSTTTLSYKISTEPIA